MSDQQLRQRFLNDPSGARLRDVRIGVVGLGGGGSQVAKFLGQAGCTSLSFFDHDIAEGVNRNRTDGITPADVTGGVLKVEIAKRLLLAHDPSADVKVYPAKWQDAVAGLMACDVVVGCIDSFAARRDLEQAARRQLSPYVDIGLDVHVASVGEQPPRMSGQVLLSIPGGPCMRCLSFLTDEKLALEASAYGGHRGRAQVGWGNGVLAATAAGIVVELITGWAQQRGPVYLQYDGNVGTLVPHQRLEFVPDGCEHFPPDQIGPVMVTLVR